MHGYSVQTVLDFFNHVLKLAKILIYDLPVVVFLKENFEAHIKFQVIVIM